MLRLGLNKILTVAEFTKTSGVLGCGPWSFSNERLNVAIYKFDGYNRLYRGTLFYLNPLKWQALVSVDKFGVNLVVENSEFAVDFQGRVNDMAALQILETHKHLLTFTTNQEDETIFSKDVYFTNISLGHISGGVYENNCVYFSESVKGLPESSGQYNEHMAVLTSN